jgi:ketosteroid isomerase-like protein
MNPICLLSAICGPGGRRFESGRSPSVESAKRPDLSGLGDEPVADRDAVIRWIAALNARDLDRILACVTPDVEFHPLKLSASRPAYVGHDGIRQWFDEVQNRHHEIRGQSLEALADDRLLVLGVIVLDGQTRPTDFAGIYRVDDGLIAGAHHYLSDRGMLSRLGVLPELG